MKLMTYSFLFLFFHSLALSQPATIQLKTEKEHKLELFFSAVGTGLQRNIGLIKFNSEGSTDKNTFKLFATITKSSFRQVLQKSFVFQSQRLKAQPFSFFVSGLSPPL